MPRKDDWSDLSDWMDSVDDMVVKEVRDTSLEFMKSITQPTDNASHKVGNTPVDSGRLMANNILSIGKPTSMSSLNTDTEGVDTYLSAAGKLTYLEPYQTVYIQNNLDYATVADTGTPKDRAWDFTAPYYFWHNNATRIESEWSGR